MSDETTSAEAIAAGVPTALEASPPVTEETHDAGQSESVSEPQAAAGGDSPSGREPQASGGGDSPSGREPQASGGGDSPSGREPQASGGGESPSGREPQASGGGESPDGAARKRRRRGKRGGRNRNRPRTPGEASAVGEAGDDDDEDLLPDSWNDPAAERGYTSDDALDVALEEADLVAPAADDAGLGAGSGCRGRGCRARRRRAGRPCRAVPEAVDPAARAPATRRQRRVGWQRRRPRQRRLVRWLGHRSEEAAPAGRAQSQQEARERGPAAESRPRRRVRAAGAPAYIEGTLETGDFDGAALLETLDEATLEKRRGLQRKGRPTGRYMMVVHTHRPSSRSHVAVLEGRNLVEHYVAEPQDDERNIDGNIYWGKVQNVQPGMEAAFVDIGTQKNAILYRGDVRADIAEADGERARIERMLRNGQSILVQVTKNPIAHKGARLTQDVSLAGRFVVMVPDQPGTYGISKRLPDDERRRLRRILDRLRPANAGLIVRTAAEGATEDELERDMRRLQYQWEQIDRLRKQVKPGTLLYKEPPLAIRVIREEFTKEYRGIAIDDMNLYNEVRAYVEAVAPELADRVEFYDEAVEGLPLFERYHVHEQLHKALDRKVWLPSGGSLVIERTEALTVIDVNTAKNVGKSNLEETVYRNNLEAAEAVARELRLRDIGGIIVIDFIDMEIKQNREAVERTFREALARDKTRTQVYPISELGLVEMTRKRVSEGLVESFSEMCPTCEGRGILIHHSLYEE